MREVPNDKLRKWGLQGAHFSCLPSITHLTEAGGAQHNPPCARSRQAQLQTQHTLYKPDSRWGAQAQPRYELRLTLPWVWYQPVWAAIWQDVCGVIGGIWCWLTALWLEDPCLCVCLCLWVCAQQQTKVGCTNTPVSTDRCYNFIQSSRLYACTSLLSKFLTSSFIHFIFSTDFSRAESEDPKYRLFEDCFGIKVRVKVADLLFNINLVVVWWAKV